MKRRDKQEHIIDALMHTLTAFQEAGFEGTEEYEMIQKIADHMFHEWTMNHTQH